MLCLIKVNSNTIERTEHTSCYCILDFLWVMSMMLYLPLLDICALLTPGKILSQPKFCYAGQPAKS